MSEDGIIVKILSVENHDSYAVVWVRLGDGMEAKVYVGGQVKVWENDYGVQAHVKFKKDLT